MGTGRSGSRRLLRIEVIPVDQTSFGYGEGDCAWACLASIFEEPLESFGYDKLMAPNDPDLAKLTACRWPHLECHTVDLGHDYRLVDGPSVPGHPHPQRWTYEPASRWVPPTDDYWMATVFSQSLKHPPESPYYGMAALHAVVMHGDRLAHDPNPRNEQKMMPLVMQTWWT